MAESSEYVNISPSECVPMNDTLQRQPKPSREEMHHRALAAATEACVAKGLCVFGSAEEMIEYFELEALMPLPVGGAAGAVAERDRAVRRQERAERRAHRQRRKKLLGDVEMEGKEAESKESCPNEDGNVAENDVRNNNAESCDASSASESDNEVGWWRPYFIPSNLTKAAALEHHEDKMIPTSAMAGETFWSRYRYNNQVGSAVNASSGQELAVQSGRGGVVSTVASAAIAIPSSLLYYSLYVPTQFAWFTASAAAKTITKAIVAPLSWWSVEKRDDWSNWVRVGYSQKGPTTNKHHPAATPSGSPLVLSDFSLYSSPLISPDFSEPRLVSSKLMATSQEHVSDAHASAEQPPDHHASYGEAYTFVGTEPQSRTGKKRHSPADSDESHTTVDNSSFASSIVDAMATVTKAAVSAAASLLASPVHHGKSGHSDDEDGEGATLGHKEKVIFLPAMQEMTARILAQLTGHAGEVAQNMEAVLTNEPATEPKQDDGQQQKRPITKYSANPFLRVFTRDEWIEFLLSFNVKSGEAITEHLILTQNITPLEVDLDVSEIEEKHDTPQVPIAGDETDTATAHAHEPSVTASIAKNVVTERALFFPLSSKESEADAKAVARWKFVAASLEAQVGYWEEALEQSELILRSLDAEESSIEVTSGSKQTPAAVAKQRETLEGDIAILKDRVQKNKLVSIECQKLHARLSRDVLDLQTTLPEIVAKIDEMMDNFGEGPWPQL